VTQTRPVSKDGGRPRGPPQPPWKQTCENTGTAAVTARPVTRNRRPPRVTWSPTRTPSAAAKARSTTTPPARTQVPAVTSGRSTRAGAAARPSAMAPAVIPRARSTGQATGYGPLLAATPGDRARACSRARAAPGGPPYPTLLATTSARIGMALFAESAAGTKDGNHADIGGQQMAGPA
jgi:hypothetical protein